MNYLEISSKDSRYVYPTGRIRGLEKYLLEDTDFARIKEGKNLEESFQTLLRFYPYSESMKICSFPEEFEKGLEEEWRRTHYELLSFAPEPELVNLFWIEQDFHNLKVMLKLYLQKKLPQEVDKIDYLSTSGVLSPEVLLKAIAKQDFFFLPSFLKDILEEALSLAERGLSSRELDLFLDKLYFIRFYSELERYGDSFLKKLGEIMADVLNIKNFIRIKLWRREREEERRILEEVIIDKGSLEKKVIVEFAGESLETFLGILKGTDYISLFQKALGEWKEKNSLFTLDSLAQELILNFTRIGFYVTFGREPLINYIMHKKVEIKKIRSILRAKKLFLSPSQMGEISL
ncbi:V-type ATPase subunit [Candidatus Aerophobetes bacterium]|nr:V-type ATPase subunit [Candidatus Aerophobetes bacterium]